MSQSKQKQKQKPKQKTAPPAGRPRISPKRALSKIVEFKGIRQLSAGQYRSHVRKLYDGPAGAVLGLGSILCLHEPLVGHMLRRGTFDVSGHATILDVGSGAGQILKHLVKLTRPDARLVAFDLSEGMLRRARKKLGDHRPAYIAGDMMRMPFADDCFDCVTCGWVLEHLQDPTPGLREVGRVLKPGGSALILATEDTFLGAMVSRAWKCRTYNRKELEHSCEQAGLPWREQLWFTAVHRFFKMGGILVQAVKPERDVPAAAPSPAPALIG